MITSIRGERLGKRGGEGWVGEIYVRGGGEKGKKIT